MDAAGTLRRTTARLRRAGCVAADDEAAELIDAAAGDATRLRHLLDRRCTGEPVAWLTGSVRFCGETVAVRPGVYVPRWQSEPLARAAVARLPDRGLAVDLCTGAGAIAVVMARRRPLARVLASEIDPVAAACAQHNGVEVYLGDLVAALPPGCDGRVDVVTAVAPYVPRSELRLLPPDVTTFEPIRALDGGPEGTRLLRRAVLGAAALLRPGGSLLLELGGEQADLLGPLLHARGFSEPSLLVDADGDVRGLVARR